MPDSQSDRPAPEAPVRRDSLPHEGVTRSTSRMEAYSDAVFAIAFTLPIVEIELPKGSAPLAQQLAEQWPDYLGYGLAVLIIGIYWTHHHYSGGITRTSGHWFNIALTLFLAAVGFIAYPARLFAERLADPAQRSTAGVFLAVSLAGLAAAWWVKWTTGFAKGHLDSRLDPGFVRRIQRRYNVSLLVNLAAAALAFVSWPLGLGLAMAVLLFYLVPPPTPIYRGKAPEVEDGNE